MPPSPIVVGFTGHRTGFDRRAVRDALTHVMDELDRQAAADRRPLSLCTSVAEGCDTLCVQLARARGWPMRLLLPLEEADFARDFSPEAWALAATELAHARQHPARHSVQVISGKALRPECYLNQALAMLQACTLLIAVSDGTPARGAGGTGSVIEIAAARSLPTVTIDATTGAVTWPKTSFIATQAQPFMAPSTVRPLAPS